MYPPARVGHRRPVVGAKEEEVPDGAKAEDPDGNRVVRDGIREALDGIPVDPDGTRVVRDGIWVDPDGTREDPVGAKEVWEEAGPMVAVTPNRTATCSPSARDGPLRDLLVGLRALLPGHRVVLDGPEVAADGAREEVPAGRAHLDGARVAAKDGLELELERDGAPPDTVAERVGLLEDMEVEMDGLLEEASEDFLADGAPVDPADGRAGKG